MYLRSTKFKACEVICRNNNFHMLLEKEKFLFDIKIKYEAEVTTELAGTN